MNEIKATYSISNRDYHMAVYYAATIRHRLAIRLFAIVGLVALSFWIGSMLGYLPAFMIPAYLFLGYLVWFLFTIAAIEHGILKYTKSSDNSLFKEMTVTFAKGMMKIDTPYNKKSASVPLSNLACAFELNDIFLIYFDAAQLVILPTRALSGTDRAELRSLLLNTLKDRFTTRFGYDSMMNKRSLFRK